MKWFFPKYLLSFLCIIFNQFHLVAQFQHRAYLGWIRDLASESSPHDEWPSIKIDSGLLHDYDIALNTMKEIGLNEIVIWGLFVSREWPVNIAASIDDTRMKQVRAIIDKAHAHHIKVLSGMGVYSWGFDAIIRANPQLACADNPHAMCLYQPESWEWQKKVIDFIFTFPIDGLNLQSADVGRCSCDESRNMSDLKYHTVINQKVIQYIRNAYPGKIISIGGWGMDIQNDSDLVDVSAMTKNADYFTEVRNNDQSSFSPAFRIKIINAIKPSLYGTTGTPHVEPPQHWERDRWFLPTAKRGVSELLALYKQGGRSVENYMQVLYNPGDEASLRLMAYMEQHPIANWQKNYEDILVKMFAPYNEKAAHELLTLFLNAEDNYFNNVDHYKATGIVRLEPLVADAPGEPVYIFERMSKFNRKKYLSATRRLIKFASSLKQKIGNKILFDRVMICLNNLQREIVYTLDK